MWGSRLRIQELQECQINIGALEGQRECGDDDAVASLPCYFYSVLVK